MVIFLTILLVLALIIVIILFTKVTVMVTYKHVSKNDKLTIIIKALFGLIRYKIIIPSIKQKKNGQGIEYKQKIQSGQSEKTKKVENKQVNEEDALKSYQDIENIVKHVFNLKKIVLRLLKKIQIKELSWKSLIGTGDAASTGVVTGAVWGIKGSVIGIISQFMTLKVFPVIEVNPHFQATVIHTELKCMIRIRVGHAILAGIQLIKYWRGHIPKFKSKNLSKINDLNN